MASAINQAPADELATLRAQKRLLQQREQELRALMLEDEEARLGKNHEAYVHEILQRRLDKNLLLKALGTLAPDMRDVTVMQIRTRPVLDQN